jgi:hypothetical protein
LPSAVSRFTLEARPTKLFSKKAQEHVSFLAGLVLSSSIVGIERIPSLR